MNPKKTEQEAKLKAAVESSEPYETRVTRITVLKRGFELFSTTATHIELDDESSGEFVRITQCTDESPDKGIAIDAEEWPAICDAITKMLSYRRLHN